MIISLDVRSFYWTIMKISYKKDVKSLLIDTKTKNYYDDMP